MGLLYAIISWTIFGLIVGGIARLLVPGRQSMGCWMTVLLGIIGSFAGGAISFVFVGGEGLIQASNWIMSIIGAVVVLAVALWMTKDK